jgi:hypothetical protein
VSPLSSFQIVNFLKLGSIIANASLVRRHCVCRHTLSASLVSKRFPFLYHML